jgi:phosphatidylglycerophosphatase GEP4
MVQSLNTKAIVTFASVVIRRPNLLIPHISVPTISDINFQALQKYAGIQAVIFDKDHTLTAPYDNTIHPEAKFGLQSCIDTFGKNNVAILSNSAGTNDDPQYKDAIAIEESIGISVIRHAVKKPGGIDEVLQHFRNSNTCDTDPTTICMIGDRILTDIVFGNLYNMVTIHTHAFADSTSIRKDNWTAKIIRPIENKLLYTRSFGKRRRIFATPTVHAKMQQMDENPFILSPGQRNKKDTINI